jgi:hypothetical protein
MGFYRKSLKNLNPSVYFIFGVILIDLLSLLFCQKLCQWPLGQMAPKLPKRTGVASKVMSLSLEVFVLLRNKKTSQYLWFSNCVISMMNIEQGMFLPLVVPPTIYQAGLWSIWLTVLCSLKV